MFLDVCIEEVNTNNRPVHVLNANGYNNLVTNFNQRTKRNYDRKQMKNMWDTLKKDYIVWKGLLQHASGLGRDPITQTIAASDDWWELEIQMCPEAAKFRIAPLLDEENLKTIFDRNVVTNVTARVPPSSQVRASNAEASQSRVNVDDIDGSGCEGDDEPAITPLRGVGKNNKTCPYSPSPAGTPKMSTGSASTLDRMIDFMEKREETKEQIRMIEEEKSRDSVTSPERGQGSARQEIRRMVALISADGGKAGSKEYFYATQLFILQEFRDVFICLEEDATPEQRLDLIRMTWEQHNKN